ncbi:MULTISPECIES: hypothetical protein [Streptomyces]|uniref:Uncharacterized protein n=1 Tax=Streptomyces phage Chymera TaxID=1821728 RepID=A0A142K657_9CAUD|nr:hypothetical protein [Streptomyces venezuelae]YP_010754243.1 hypothetical protein QEH31_gp31 [Streptomyces phage Chymera]AMS01590.1 hypothetical protein SEA_CHYMERA_31 [Streptomyces phage Chymera]APE22056.1 hypothetical protein vnz_14200 [Streptomyces venezuelae]QER99445.1 hypothetical protein DEJ43_14380 [Streptomyces venezuelae ATCC 10712]
MTDVVRVAVLGVLALGVVTLALIFRSLRGQVDDLRAEVACLRIERLLGEPAVATEADQVRTRRPELGVILGAAIGAVTATAATWLLWG